MSDMLGGLSFGTQPAPTQQAPPAVAVDLAPVSDLGPDQYQVFWMQIA